ncbi:hypothetical protein OIU79_008069 [Salix purpurea]|uniref:Uncharacterized protein n=1 Tax=Salix purpurea TaxID=77065 RepID=A0A9Q0YVM7_SALPP|nr:hypothetical protein OIU79_008069 [Salix purpurea]
MSITKTFSLNSKAVKDDQVSAKRRRSDRCFSFKEISIEPGKSLKHMDSNKFKIEIKRWAKAVVAYARQVSSRFGSNRRSGRIGSSRDSSQETI